MGRVRLSVNGLPINGMLFVIAYLGGITYTQILFGFCVCLTFRWAVRIGLELDVILNRRSFVLCFVAQTPPSNTLFGVAQTLSAALAEGLHRRG